MVNDRILSKIEKCFKLSEGTSNPHEAQAALDKAMKLLAKYNLTHDDIEMSKIDSRMTDMRVPYVQPRYIQRLAGAIANCFKLRLHYSTRYTGVNGGAETRPRFTGEATNVGLAVYCFDFLFRGLKIAKKAYRKKLADEFEENFGYKLSKAARYLKQKVKDRVECYCLSYVSTVITNLQNNAMTKTETELAERYLEQQLEWDLSDVKKARTSKPKFNGYREDHDSGCNDGKKVEVNTPINGSEQLKLA